MLPGLLEGGWGGIELQADQFRREVGTRRNDAAIGAGPLLEPGSDQAFDDQIEPCCCQTVARAGPPAAVRNVWRKGRKASRVYA